MPFADRDVAGISALPTRFGVGFICSCAHNPIRWAGNSPPRALGLAPHQAKFHLDRLKRDGLLDSALRASERPRRNQVRAGPQSCIDAPTARSRCRFPIANTNLRAG